MAIINTELLAMTLIAGLVIFTVGYLLARLLSGKKLGLTEQAYQKTQAELDQTTEKHNNLASEFGEAQSKIRQLELEHKRLETLHESQLENLQSIQAELRENDKAINVAIQARHDAEKSHQAAQTELNESKKNLQALEQRLNLHIEEIKIERDNLNAQKAQNAALDKEAKTYEIKAQESESKYQESKTQAVNLQNKHDDLQEKYTGLTARFTELKTSLEERDISHEKQLAQFEEQKKALAEQFKVLASEILDAKTKALQESSKISLSSVMNPFQQSIDSFKKEVQDIHHRETIQQGELRKELESMKVLNQKITLEAHELSTALRGQKKLQGNWGELVLENVLDRSGLQLGVDYKREVSFTTEDGRQRPDAIIYLPQEKHLIIDAKVSLVAYTRYVNSEHEAERQQALNEHVSAMSDRITELADRDYYKLPGLNSPEIVFMFVPIESAFVEALKADETLFQKAIENNVLVATPTTLLTSLNIVRQLWRYEDQNKHTAALAGKADTVFKKLNAFLDSFAGVKKGLDKATEAYTKAEGQLVSGRGNLVKQVGEFKNLAPAIKAELPAYFTDKANLEIDYIPVDQQLEGKGEGMDENVDKKSDSVDELTVGKL